jgi:protein-L-isoaspartate(D-aspartate) O-methyltransferase
VDFNTLREQMVRNQLISRGIKNKKVLDAMSRVPRHLFVEDAMVHSAYADMALPIGDGQTISQPYMVAIMTELLELSAVETVLEIGTGSGYQAAILAELCKEVYSIERLTPVADRAIHTLDALNYKNIHVQVGDGTRGWPAKAPFDRIMITAASPKIPDPLIEQLEVNGILLLPIGTRHAQQLLKVRKKQSGLTEEYHTPCVFVPLVGKYGWENEE